MPFHLGFSCRCQANKQTRSITISCPVFIKLHRKFTFISAGVWDVWLLSVSEVCAKNGHPRSHKSDSTCNERAMQNEPLPCVAPNGRPCLSNETRGRDSHVRNEIHSLTAVLLLCVASWRSLGTEVEPSYPLLQSSHVTVISFLPPLLCPIPMSYKKFASLGPHRYSLNANIIKTSMHFL